MRDANDPVEAVHAAARLLKEAAQWSARKIAGLQLDREQRAARLREGVSIYYNLSSAARARWNGVGSETLPVETQRHIRNVREGAQQAERIAGGAQPAERGGRGRIEPPKLAARLRRPRPGRAAHPHRAVPRRRTRWAPSNGRKAGAARWCGPTAPSRRKRPAACAGPAARPAGRAG